MSMVKRLAPRSEFMRQVLTLMTGTGIAQALPLIASPILSRLYSPAEFGIFTLFASITSILSVLATGRYELAIVLPEDEQQSANLVGLSVILSFAISLLTLLAVMLFGTEISVALKSPEIKPWLYWVPIAVFLTACYQSLNYWFNRKQRYDRLALNRMSRAGLQVVTSVGLGFQRLVSGGLILGQVFGQGVATGVFATAAFREDREKFARLDWSSLRAVANRYGDFPKYSIPADGLNSVSQQLPVLLLSAFGQAAVGQFGFVQRVMGAPFGIVAGSFADVFKQRASRDYNQTGSCREIWLKTFYRLMAISIPICVVLMICAPPVFAFVFGEKWRIAGLYAQALAPMYMIQFAASPLSRTLYIAEKQRYDLAWQIGLFVLLGIALKLGIASGHDLTAIRAFGAAYAFMYLVYLAMSYRFTNNANFLPTAEDLNS